MPMYGRGPGGAMMMPRRHNIFKVEKLFVKEILDSCDKKRAQGKTEEDNITLALQVWVHNTLSGAESYAFVPGYLVPEELRCRLSKTIPTIPVTLHGNLYDLEKLYKYIITHHTDPADPEKTAYLNEIKSHEKFFIDMKQCESQMSVQESHKMVAGPSRSP